MITYEETTREVVETIIEAVILEFITPLDETYSKVSKLPLDIREQWLEKLWNYTEENKNFHWFGAFDKGDIVGCLNYQYISKVDSPIEKEFVYMGHSYLDPQYRGQGVYSKLRRFRGEHICKNFPGIFAIHNAREDGVTYANCTTSKGHQRANMFRVPYEKLNGIRYYLLSTYATSPDLL